MTNYALSIRAHNIQAHLDIESDIQERRTGLLTMTIRVNNGNIVDYNTTDYVPITEKYGIIRALVIEEVTIELPTPPNYRE